MNLYIDILANLIIQHYFQNSRCLLIFSDTISYFGNIPVIRIGSDEYMDEKLIFNYFGCQGIVIANSKPVWTFQTFENLIRLKMERFNSRSYLVLPRYNTEENITSIFDLEELMYVADLVVVEEHSEMKKNFERLQAFMNEDQVAFDLWTHQYIGGTENKKKLFLDSWYSDTRKFKYNNTLYPNKLLNQMGRPLRIAAFQYEPYSIIGSTEDDFKGSEMSVAVAFFRHYNMTPELIINTDDYWGKISFPNWSGNGLLGNLAADRADVGFSALYTWEVDYHFLDLSKPLVRTGITLLVPAPKLAAGWLTPLYSYSGDMWIAVGIVFIISILSLFSLHYIYTKIEREERRGNPSKPSLAQLFGYSAFSIIKLFTFQALNKTEVPNCVNGTYFTGLLLLFSLFLTSSYSSGLSSIMTIPRYENPINTVDDLIESGLYWGATQEAWITSIQYTDVPKYQTIVDRFVPTTEENLRELSKKGGFGFSLERLPHENYAVGIYIKKDVIKNFHLMKEDIYWEQCVFMTRKSSILLRLLDMFILKVFEAGLIGYWQNEAVSLYMDSDVQKAVKYYYHHQDSGFSKLKWSHIQGAIGALYLGCLISTAVFLVEIVSNKIKVIPKSLSAFALVSGRIMLQKLKYKSKIKPKKSSFPKVDSTV